MGKGTDYPRREGGAAVHLLFDKDSGVERILIELMTSDRKLRASR